MKHIFCLLLLAFGCIFSSKLTLAQTPTIEVYGVVKDSLTGEPLPFANVFIASSTIGVSTDNQGKFAFPKIKAGVYEIVVSFIGYQTSMQVLDVEEGKRYEVNFKVPQKIKQLKAVQVKSLSDKEWQLCFKTFEKDFIGRSKVASKTKIKNPTILDFAINAEEKQISGSTNEPLVIENKALGYKLFFVLDDYASVEGRYVSYIGKPRYEEMKPKSKREARKWKAARLEAYHGSFQHFINALLKNELEKEGFGVIAVKKGKGFRTTDGQAVQRDSIFFRTEQPHLFAMTISEKQNLQITYFGEPEESAYARLNWKSAAEVQTSEIEMKEKYLLLDRTGYIYNPLGIILLGYWSWEKIAEMLPIDYVPE